MTASLPGFPEGTIAVAFMGGQKTVRLSRGYQHGFYVEHFDSEGYDKSYGSPWSGDIASAFHTFVERAGTPTTEAKRQRAAFERKADAAL